MNANWKKLLSLLLVLTMLAGMMPAVFAAEEEPDAEPEQVVRVGHHPAATVHHYGSKAVIEPGDEGTIDDYIDRADKYMYAEKEKYHKYIDSIDHPKD